MSYTRLERLKLLLNAFGGMAGPDSTLDRYLLQADRDICRRALAYQTAEYINLEAGVRSYALPSYWYKSFAVLADRRLAYLRLLDQTGVAWYLYVTPIGELAPLSPTVPPGVDIAEGLTLSWLQWDGPDGTGYKVYPSPIGELVVAPEATVLTGAGTTETIELRDYWGNPWYPLVTDVPEVRTQRTATQRTSFQMYTQAGSLRYVAVETDGTLVPDDESPADGLDATFHPELSWFIWASPNGTLWKVYLDNDGDFAVVDGDTALVGYGTAQKFVVHDARGTPWFPGVSNVGVLETGVSP